MAENIDFGRVAFVLEDEWNSAAHYSRLSTVFYSYDGCAYVAKQANQGILPDSNPNVWMKMSQKGDKGDKGDEPTITSETDSQGNFYILVDGERILDGGGNPLSFRGPKGDKGDKGDTPNLDVASEGGNAYLVVDGVRKAVNIKGPKGDKGDKGDALKYSELTNAQKAELKGATGEAAGFGTPTASVNGSTGTPSVTVSASGPDTAKVFAFTFSNLKGAKGDKGDKGNKGDKGDPGDITNLSIGTSTQTSLNGVLQGNGATISVRPVTNVATQNSTDLMTSGGVYTIVGNIEALLASI